jgi:hypothetical protein
MVQPLMSYDLWLEDPKTGEELKAESLHQLRGGNYVIGGTRNCALNITYNYGPHYYRVLGDKGIRAIYGMTALESIPVLRKAADQLGLDIDEDYWKATEGNARKALEDLMIIATMAPHGIWNGD